MCVCVYGYDPWYIYKRLGQFGVNVGPKCQENSKSSVVDDNICHFELRCCQYWLVVGRNWMWVRYSPTNYTNWFGEITWCNIFPIFAYVFSYVPNVFNHLMGNHWCFPERSLRHGHLRDDKSPTRPIQWGTGDIPSSWYQRPGNLNKHSTEKTTSSHHIQTTSNIIQRRPPHVICLWTSIHHYIYPWQNHKLQDHPTSSQNYQNYAQKYLKRYQQT